MAFANFPFHSYLELGDSFDLMAGAGLNGFGQSAAVTAEYRTLPEPTESQARSSSKCHAVSQELD